MFQHEYSCSNVLYYSSYYRIIMNKRLYLAVISSTSSILYLLLLASTLPSYSTLVVLSIVLPSGLSVHVHDIFVPVAGLQLPLEERMVALLLGPTQPLHLRFRRFAHAPSIELGLVDLTVQKPPENIQGTFGKHQLSCQSHRSNSASLITVKKRHVVLFRV